jgi:alkylated DNA repair dioxygenase AlkB
MIMDLFNKNNNHAANLLPYDGTVNYYGQIFNTHQSQMLFHNLMNGINWQQDEIMMFGKLITTKRKVAWYAQQELEYTYSKKTKKAIIFTPELLEIKAIVEQQCKESFNACLLNLYHSGEEGMGWHSDAEKELEPNGAIASVSFGVPRKFVFKHKEDKTTFPLMLENGSLLVMKNQTQQNWLHSLPISKRIKSPRINLTFRTII